MGYWPSLRSRWLDIGQPNFSRVYRPSRSRGPETRKKNNKVNIQPSWPHIWSIKDLLYGFRRNFSCGIRRVVPSWHDRWGSQSQRMIRFMLPAHGASHIIIRFLHLISVWMSDLQISTKFCNCARLRKEIRIIGLGTHDLEPNCFHGICICLTRLIFCHYKVTLMLLFYVWCLIDCFIIQLHFAEYK